MNTHFFDRYSRHCFLLIYLSIWLAGICFGIVTSVNNRVIAIQSLSGACAVTLSVIPGILANATAVLMVHFALRCHKPLIVCILLFLNSFSFAFCGCAIVLMAGEAAWLIGCLFLFTRVCVFVIMWWMLLHNTLRNMPISRLTLCFFIAVTCMVSIFDSLFVSPILSESIQYL